MEQFNSPFFTIKCISPIKWVLMLTHTLPVLYNFFKGKKPTQSIAFEVTLPEEFYTEVIYCLAQLKGFFFFLSEPMIWCLSKIIPFETTQAKIFTKVRHSQTT